MALLVIVGDAQKIDHLHPKQSSGMRFDGQWRPLLTNAIWK